MKEFEKQSKQLWELRDSLKNIKTNVLKPLLEFNKLESSGGRPLIIQKISEYLLFGFPLCPECGNRTLLYQNGDYKCFGDISEWSKCSFKGEIDDSKTVLFKIPKSINDKFLKKYKPSKIKRISLAKREKEKHKDDLDEEGDSDGDDEEDDDKGELILSGIIFAFAGSIKNKKKLTGVLTKYGAEVVARVQKKVDYVICAKPTLKQKGVQNLIKQKKGALSLDFVETLSDKKIADFEGHLLKGKLRQGIKKLVVQKRKPKKKRRNIKKEEETEEIETVVEKKKVIKKFGIEMDPDCEQSEYCHVLNASGVIWNSVLSATNISTRTNSYYNIQLLQHDTLSSRCYVWTRWGRTGSTIGDYRLYGPYSVKGAKKFFKEKFYEKSGNDWQSTPYRKIKKKFFPMDIQYDFSDEEDEEESESTLAKPVQQLMEMIFDEKAIKAEMKEMEIDVTKLPLGNLTKDQIGKANRVLTNLQTILKRIEKKSDNVKKKQKSKILDFTNRFYTLIPHVFKRSEEVPLIDNLEKLRTKVELLDTLRNIEIASSILKRTKLSKGESKIDARYNELEIGLTVLDKKSEEFKMITNYVKKTHAPTHNQYELVVEEVFVMNKETENERFKKYVNKGPRYLLWHGSRKSNFPGILKNSLLIAPPEAPVTGYMFGKGIYFADSVSKSANYCRTTPTNNIGLLILNEVYLGKKYKITRSEYMEKAPNGKHSTKGCGKMLPDPKERVETKDGIIIPTGTLTTDSNYRGSLRYNEYIVYDIGQTRMKYLLKTKFVYKQRRGLFW
eukprot:Anaeramoba_flamelloidesa325131_610.p1 GENE.a325131_610~~a325131_610.p1  ORF type:complete len:783 (-),score=227.76 a325131_610:31-2379(-)